MWACGGAGSWVSSPPRRAADLEGAGLDQRSWRGLEQRLCRSGAEAEFKGDQSQSRRRSTRSDERSGIPL